MKYLDLVYAFLIGSSIQSTVISTTFIVKKYLSKFYKPNFSKETALLPVLAPILFGIANIITVYLVYDLKYTNWISYYIGAILGLIFSLPNLINIDPLSTVFGIKIKNGFLNGIISVLIYIFVFGYLIGSLNNIAFNSKNII